MQIEIMRGFHKSVSKANHSCWICHKSIPEDSFCYTNINNSKHVCTDCVDKVAEYSKP